MKRSINSIEQKIPKDLIGQIYFIRENEVVTTEIRRREINKGISKLFQGKITPEEIRVNFRKRKKRELIKIKKLIKDLQKSPYTINIDAHNITIKLTQHLNNKFPNQTIQVVMIGSNVQGGAFIKKQLVIDQQKASDFDCGILISGYTKPASNSPTFDIYVEQKTLLIEITDEMKKFLDETEYKLCHSMNPTLLHALTIESVEDAEEMLHRYFRKLIHDDGALYFQPTYPIEAWEKNMMLIEQALVNIRRKNRTHFSIIQINIEKLLTKTIDFKPSHFSGKNAKDVNSTDYKVSLKISRTITDLLRSTRIKQIKKSKKPNYLLK